MSEVYDTYIEFENGKTKLNEETFNKLQDLIKKDIRENGGGSSVEIIQQNETATSTNVYSAQAVNELINETSVNIITGQEVATNVFADGKQRYIKRIDIGILPNATEKRVATGILTTYKIEGFARSGVQTLNLPFSYRNDVIELCIIDNNATLLINTNNNKEAFVGYVDIYYTKEENQTVNEEEE